MYCEPTWKKPAEEKHRILACIPLIFPARFINAKILDSSSKGKFLVSLSRNTHLSLRMMYSPWLPVTSAPVCPQHFCGVWGQSRVRLPVISDSTPKSSRLSWDWSRPFFVTGLKERLLYVRVHTYTCVHACMPPHAHVHQGWRRYPAPSPSALFHERGSCQTRNKQPHDCVCAGDPNWDLPACTAASAAP